MNGEMRASLGGCAISMLCMSVLLAATRNCGTYDPGVGSTTTTLDPTPPLREVVTHAPASSATSRADARLSQPEASTVQGRAMDDSQSRRAVQLPTGILSSYEDSFLPTEEGLIEMTLGLWMNEDFLALTQDEAHELLALDDTMGMHGPDSMLSIVGPLPTEDDCRRGFQDERVRQALEVVCYWDIAIVEVPKQRRDELLPRLIELLDRSMLDLMKELERATGCKTWSLWWRMYREWSRG